VLASVVHSHTHHPADTITLDETARHRRRFKMVSDGGIEFLLNLPEARLLRHGEGIELEDGRVIEVIAKPEPLYEIRGRDPHHLIALAWQLGNRHLAAQIEPTHILIRQDHVIKQMLEGLGASVVEVTASFNPQGGAYEKDHHGLEQAIASELVYDRDSLIDWFVSLLKQGAGWNDAVVLAEAWRITSNEENLAEIANLSEAMSISKERHLETMAQGSAFLKAAIAWGEIPKLPKDCSLPVAVGSVAASQNIELEATLTAFLHAYVSNQIQAALRLMKLGQQGGVEVLVQVESLILDLAKKASQTTLDDLGGASFMADICAMKHEKLQTRIFRS